MHIPSSSLGHWFVESVIDIRKIPKCPKIESFITKHVFGGLRKIPEKIIIPFFSIFRAMAAHSDTNYTLFVPQQTVVCGWLRESRLRLIMDYCLVNEVKDLLYAWRTCLE